VGKLELDKKYSRNISVAHIYFGENELSTFDQFSDYFMKYDLIDAQNEESLPPTSNIFLIEIDEIKKSTLRYIQRVSIKHYASHIYLFSKLHSNPTILKFAINIGAKGLFPLEQKDEFFIDFLDRAIKKSIKDIHEANLSYFGSQLDGLYPVVIFEKEKVSFANSAAKKFFKIDNISKIEKLILKNIELASLIREKKSLNITLMLENGKKEFEEQLCSIAYDKKSDKAILSILLNKNIIEDDIAKLLQNRFIFIEKLKDKIVQNSIDNNNIFLLLVAIDKENKMKDLYSKVEYFEFLKSFLLKLNLLKDNRGKIVEWSQGLFVMMYENISYKEIKEKASILHNSLIENLKESKFASVITTSFFSIKDKDLDHIIKFMYKIENNSITLDESVRENYHEYKYLSDQMSEKDQIAHLLNNCINNKIPVKLLNIYKGLCVNTESKVLKHAEGFFYLSCDKLQRYTIQLDKETIIQSETFPHDIKAVVKFIDLNKSYIIVEKFEFLQNSANNRQHTRVQPTVRTPISIKVGNSALYGEILDLSINSIALKTKQKIDEQMKGNKVIANFKLPNKKSEDGFAIVSIEAEILIISNMEKFTKIVLKISEEDGANTQILQYIYVRQKELVFELKNALKVIS